MKAPQLLNDLRSRGVVLSVNGDRLRFDGPREALTPEVLAQVKAQKSALILLLRYASSAASGTTLETNSPASTCTLDFAPREAYDPDAATVEAHRMFAAGEVNEKQRDNLLKYATEAETNTVKDGE